MLKDTCKFSGIHSDAPEVCALLGFYVALIGSLLHVSGQLTGNKIPVYAV